MIQKFFDKRKDFISWNLKWFSKGKELLQSEERFSIIFLDIALEDMDGMEVGKIVTKKRSCAHIVLVHNRIVRLQEAFSIHVFNYIIKPIEKTDLEETLDLIINKKDQNRKIKLWKQRQCYDVDEENIEYIQTYDSYTEFISGREIYRGEYSLKSLENVLNQQLFFRVDRKYIINFKWIEEYTDGYVIIDGKNIKVSRRRKKEFDEKYYDFLQMN